MPALDLGRRPRRFRLALPLAFFVSLAGLVVGAYFLLPRLEWHAPQITITPESDVLGLAPFAIAVADRGTGLESLKVTLTSGGAEHALADERYDPRIREKKLTVGLSSKLTGLKEGPAVLHVQARDGSLWRFLGGNATAVRKEITIDVSPPVLEVIADDPYINFGGSGLIVYRASADAIRSGVKIGRHFFPGYKAHPKDPDAYLAFFAHPYDVPETERAALIAVDKAGNERRVPIAYSLKSVRYRTSTISLSDEFIQNKVAPLLNDVAARQESARDVFIRVNRSIRKQNEDTIKALGEKSRPAMLWSGAFGQLTNSKVEANFADARTYVYQDQQIDTAYHLGFDLSVTKRYPVEAANSGVVAFVGDLGIYGNTVLIDHGLGLITLYAHLSSIDVKTGDEVTNRRIIGRTGETGLAAGDHLHFAVYLHGVPVLPLEWWDPKWIKDNIEAKLDPTPVAAESEGRPAAKPARKRRVGR